MSVLLVVLVADKQDIKVINIKLTLFASFGNMNLRRAKFNDENTRLFFLKVPIDFESKFNFFQFVDKSFSLLFILICTTWISI